MGLQDHLTFSLLPLLLAGILAGYLRADMNEPCQSQVSSPRFILTCENNGCTDEPSYACIEPMGRAFFPGTGWRDYKYCQCSDGSFEPVEPICCHIVQLWDNGKVTGRAVRGECNPPNAECESGNCGININTDEAECTT